MATIASEIERTLTKMLIKKISQNNGLVEMNVDDWTSTVKTNLPELDQNYSKHNLFTFLSASNYFKYKPKISNGKMIYHIELHDVPKICKNYTNPEGCNLIMHRGNDCKELHCCLHYLSGKCKFKAKCKFSHNLLDEHNKPILKSFLMHRLTKEEICSLLNIENVLENKRPLICKGYNSKSGCLFGNQCVSIHLCNYYIQQDCKYGKNCKRSHNLLEPCLQEVLVKRGIDIHQRPRQIILDIQKLINFSPNKNSDEDDENDIFGLSESDEERKKKNLFGKMQKKSIVKTRSKLAEDSNDARQICTFHLRGKCLFGDNCALYHQTNLLPYQWQYEETVGTWLNLEENQSIEKAFCDCLSTYKISCTKRNEPDIEITFETMSYRQLEIKSSFLRKVGCVRRLSTDSQLNQPHEYDFLTHWKWFWLDNRLLWTEYLDDQGYPSSNTLENEYQNNRSKKFSFTASAPKKFSYEVDFDNMKQTNLSTKAERKILRRPDFFDPTCRKPMSISFIEKTKDSLEIIFPKTWETTLKDDSNAVQLISIGKTSNEFKEIEALFHQTVKIPLKSVTRIQNKPLWSFYYMKKQAILKKKPGLAITKRLFHGTSENLIDAICHQGFDFRLSGSRIGHAFGYGSYFARDASVSCGYTNSGQLFVVEVAVGEYTKGLRDYRRPPQKGLASLDLYDSCVNDPLNPSTFVIFDNHQAYPEYLIRY